MLQRKSQQLQLQQDHRHQNLSDRQIHKMALVVVLLSCSWTCAVASGTEDATASQPEAIPVAPDGSMVALWNSQSMQFLKQFMVSVIKDAMMKQGIRCESATDQDLKVLRLIEEAVQLQKDLEQVSEATGGQKIQVGDTEQGVATGSTSDSKEDVKKSASDVFRDHKLKTLFRWGKRK